jgi:hypothetical protein
MFSGRDRTFVDTREKPVCSAAMRPNRSLCELPWRPSVLRRRAAFEGLSLSLASVLALSLLPGCNKLEELTGGKKEEAKPEEPKKDEVVAEAVKPTEPIPAEAVEEIPVVPLATGLDLMLELVPAGAEFMIARDATVVAEYMEEAVRFADGPLGLLKTGPFAGEGDLVKLDAGLGEAKGKIDAVKVALAASGIELDHGALMAKAKDGAEYFVFKAADPTALVAVGKAMGETSMDDLKCKGIEDVPGYHVCAESDAKLATYARSADAAPARKLLADNLPGVDLDAANLVAHIDAGRPDETFMAVSTIPGQMYIAVNRPGDPGMAELQQGMQPGPAKTLAQVQPGAGFVWARLSPALLTKEMAGGNPMAESVGRSLTGELVLAGSVDPGGVILQLGTSDTATLESMLTTTFDALGPGLPTEVPELPGAKLVFEKLPITGGDKTAQGLHAAITNVPEADVLKGFTGLHLDAWVFAANDVLTVAVGPDKEGIGKLLDVSTGGPAQPTLDALPPQLAEALGRNEVGLIAHMPMDFLHGAQLHNLANAALKELPDVPPAQLFALSGLLAPFSSATLWITKPGDKPIVHISVQAIGNRATEEGKAALEAAHTVADGGDPAVAFASLASIYAASPMAWAYKTRAGTDGPGYMVGSGVGAVMAVAAVAIPVVMGKRNTALADDLGVAPDAPEPELVPTTAPQRPKTTPAEPKPATPKKDPKKDQPTVKPTEPKDEPIVEPTRPLPPKPTPDEPDEPTGPRKPKHIGRGAK